MELAKRDDVPVELTWDLSLIYPTEEAMQESSRWRRFRSAVN